MAYEELKRDYNKYKKVPSDAKLVSFKLGVTLDKVIPSSCSPSSPSFSYGQDALEYVTMAALSKIFAVATTYPYQVVRARLQDQHNRYGGVVDVIGRTWRYGSAGTGRLDPASFSRSLSPPPPQKRRSFGLLQRHRPKFDPRHAGLLHHFCGL